MCKNAFVGFFFCYFILLFSTSFFVRSQFIHIVYKCQYSNFDVDDADVDDVKYSYCLLCLPMNHYNTYNLTDIRRGNIK